MLNVGQRVNSAYQFAWRIGFLTQYFNQTGRGEYEEAERELKIAQAELDEHHKHHERTEKLLRIGAASREELEQATTKLRTAEAEAEADQPLRSELSYFVDCIRTRSAPRVVTLADAVAGLEAADAAIASLKTGQLVRA